LQPRDVAPADALVHADAGVPAAAVPSAPSASDAKPVASDEPGPAQVLPPPPAALVGEQVVSAAPQPPVAPADPVDVAVVTTSADVERPDPGADTDPLPPPAAVAEPAEAPQQVAPPAPADAAAAAVEHTMRVPAGASLEALAREVYGVVDAHVIRRIQSANPQVTDPNHILAGDLLRFPAGDAEGAAIR
jgi:nucleoid-associated protein YgaU